MGNDEPEPGTPRPFLTNIQRSNTTPLPLLLLGNEKGTSHPCLSVELLRSCSLTPSPLLHSNGEPIPHPHCLAHNACALTYASTIITRRYRGLSDVYLAKKVYLSFLSAVKGCKSISHLISHYVYNYQQFYLHL